MHVRACSQTCAHHHHHPRTAHLDAALRSKHASFGISAGAASSVHCCTAIHTCGGHQPVAAMALASSTRSPGGHTARWLLTASTQPCAALPGTNTDKHAAAAACDTAPTPLLLLLAWSCVRRSWRRRFSAALHTRERDNGVCMCVRLQAQLAQTGHRLAMTAFPRCLMMQACQCEGPHLVCIGCSACWWVRTAAASKCRSAAAASSSCSASMSWGGCCCGLALRLAGK